MYRNNLNKFLVVILLVSAIFSFYVTRYTMQRVPSISSEDANRIAELEDIIERLQKQIVLAEGKEEALRTDIDRMEQKAKETIENIPESFAASEQDKKEKLGLETMLTCRHIDSIKIVKTIAQGYTKIVQEGVLLGQSVAIKSANNEARSVTDCLKEGLHAKEGECYLLANYKVLKEIMVLRQLHHRNIVRLLGMCVRSENSSPSIKERGVTMVVEEGQKIQLHQMMERSWSFRAQIFMQLAALLDYLSNSSMGSIALSDMKDEQFIMVKGTIKLTDLDDIYASEPKCDNDHKCLYKGRETNIKCQTDMRCAGMNAYANLQSLLGVFPILKEGCPEQKKSALHEILNKVSEGEIDAGTLEKKLESLLEQ